MLESLDVFRRPAESLSVLPFLYNQIGGASLAAPPRSYRTGSTLQIGHVLPLYLRVSGFFKVHMTVSKTIEFSPSGRRPVHVPSAIVILETPKTHVPSSNALCKKRDLSICGDHAIFFRLQKSNCRRQLRDKKYAKRLPPTYSRQFAPDIFIESTSIFSVLKVPNVEGSCAEKNVQNCDDN